MIKIGIDKTIHGSLQKGAGALQRSYIRLFPAGTGDELLSIHTSLKMDLIISRLDAPGMPVKNLFEELRSRSSLREFRSILYCKNDPEEKRRAVQCAPTMVMTLPVDGPLLLEKAQSLLNVSRRESYRVLLKVSIDVDGNNAFFCRSENISVTGLLLETDRHISPGTSMACSFFIPGAKHIVVAAQVVREMSRPGSNGVKHYGVKFTRISAEDAAAIDNFVREKLGKQRGE